ncbi:hypothetical protein CCACVL1_23103 [Corchorus capsularis]|uniref:Uncharacterized protein n=1 Tax=Corchorus capsularis TaxID=210143 RepID=A0A1R3GVC9_COCAP|nr:hypothetical protein CCACVL1_23103 [Corchorus capsularis]
MALNPRSKGTNSVRKIGGNLGGGLAAAKIGGNLGGGLAAA